MHSTLIVARMEPGSAADVASLFGAFDDKAGMAGSIHDLLRHPRLNHRPEVQGGVREAECGALLTAFFRERRSATG